MRWRMQQHPGGTGALVPAPAPPPARKLSVDEVLAARIKLPPGTSPLSQEDIDRAIAEGATGR